MAIHSSILAWRIFFKDFLKKKKFLNFFFFLKKKIMKPLQRDPADTGQIPATSRARLNALSPEPPCLQDRARIHTTASQNSCVVPESMDLEIPAWPQGMGGRGEQSRMGWGLKEGAANVRWGLCGPGGWRECRGRGGGCPWRPGRLLQGTEWVAGMVHPRPRAAGGERGRRASPTPERPAG